MFKEIFENLKIKLLEGIKEAVSSFITTLWNYVKEEVINSAKQSLDLLSELIKSEVGQAKKEFIVDIIMQKINLPFVLKPFKGLIKKLLANKIEEAVEAIINKGHEFVG